MEPADLDRLTLTPVGAELASRRQGGRFGQVDSMLQLLAPVDLVEGRWEIDEGIVATAVRAYKDRARRR